MAAYYTLAWFDLQLKGDPTGFDRLTATKFDDSVDRTSIGAGVYDPAEADPTDPYSGNNPIMIEGIPVKDAVSFYYLSEYALHHPETCALVACGDMRSGCASTATARKRTGLKRTGRKRAARKRAVRR